MQHVTWMQERQRRKETDRDREGGDFLETSCLVWAAEIKIREELCIFKSSKRQAMYANLFLLLK